MRRKNPARKSAKKSGGSKIKIHEISVLPKAGPKNFHKIARQKRREKRKFHANFTGLCWGVALKIPPKTPPWKPRELFDHNLLRANSALMKASRCHYGRHTILPPGIDAAQQITSPACHWWPYGTAFFHISKPLERLRLAWS